MSLFSSLRKGKQEPASEDAPFVARSEAADAAPARSRKRAQSGQSGREAPIDPVLPEKKRARRRLIGAVALVLAAVVGLPMILDSEPKPLADDIAIQIPSKDKPSKPAPAREPEKAPLPAHAGLDNREEVVDSGTAERADRLAENPKANGPTTSEADEKAAASKPAETPKAAVLAKSATPVAPGVVESAKPVEKNTEKSQDAARAKALLDGKSDPKLAAEKKVGSTYVIQVAALTSKEKVQEVQAKLKDAGIKSYTQTVATESGERIRVRVGPFDSKESADKMRAKLGKLGLGGTLVPT